MITIAIPLVFIAICPSKAFRSTTVYHKDSGMINGWASKTHSRTAVQLMPRSFNRGRRETTTHAASESTVTTERVALGDIFDTGRKYLFSTKMNLRSYEWSTDEAETLFDDILYEVESDNPGDLELNAINILRKNLSDKEERSIGKPCALYDVRHSHSF